MNPNWKIRMPIEASLIKPVVDAILGLVGTGRDVKLKHDAAKAVREAIRELLMADPNENEVEAKLAIAKAAGLISHDVVLADEMLRKVKATKRPAAARGVGKKSAKPPAHKAGKAAAKAPAKKPGRKT
jgi:hypothetical protein